MSWNGSGTYTLPSGNPVVSGTNISSTWANNTLQDLSAGLNNVLCLDGQNRPTNAINWGAQNLTNVNAFGAVTATLTTVSITTLAVSGSSTLGATSLASATLSGPLNEAKGTDIASAATVNIGAATANYINITGTTTITAFDTIQAGTRRLVRFTGSLLLTNNANIIIPGGSNYTTAAGDVFEFVSEGGGVWRVSDYALASGYSLVTSISGPIQGTRKNLKSTAPSPITTTGNTNSSTSITNVASVTGMIANGTYITGSGIPANTYITAISGAGPYTLTISNAATATATGVSLTAYALNNRTTTADALAVADGAGNYKTLTSINVTGNIGAAVGANSLDTGSLAASTWYYEHVIYNPTTTTSAKLYSLSSTSPTLPSGYTMWARTGAARTDANKILYYTASADRLNWYVVTPGTNVPTAMIMASGTSGNPATPTWTALSVSSFVPPTAAVIDVGVLSLSSGAQTIVAPNQNYGSYSSTTNPPPINCQSTSSWGAVLSKRMPLESTNLYFASNATAGNNPITCFGWEDNL